MEPDDTTIADEATLDGPGSAAAPPLGAAGNVMYGSNVNAAAILLASEGNVPLERTAMLMAALLGWPVVNDAAGSHRRR